MREEGKQNWGEVRTANKLTKKKRSVVLQIHRNGRRGKDGEEKTKRCKPKKKEKTNVNQKREGGERAQTNTLQTENSRTLISVGRGGEREGGKKETETGRREKRKKQKCLAPLASPSHTNTHSHTYSLTSHLPYAT